MLEPVIGRNRNVKFSEGDLVYFVNRETGREVSGRIINIWTYLGWPHYDVRLTPRAKNAIRVPQIHCSAKPVVRA
jgi:hypothetical protein